ncbi:hypothetical protein GCM10028778_03620 [Barrientosiimonas marina]|uniref:protein-glutamate methylesterase n=1 Tax=Lentibacillus kimchii TaxID=1542911 RepID=A0ABW2UPX1_9BACI
MRQFNTIAGIGASTGGPKALECVLAELPGDFAAPVLIAQHMPPGFTASLAARFDQTVAIRVKEATQREIIEPATAYIAPGDYHMTVKQSGTDYSIELTRDAKRHGQRPSVDVLFESLARLQHVRKMCAVLTGMGRDGSEGIKALKMQDQQAVIVAESELTSVVYGMPKAAMDTRLVTYSVPIQQIGGLIHHLARPRL